MDPDEVAREGVPLRIMLIAMSLAVGSTMIVFWVFASKNTTPHHNL
jgi:hypothetical protein